MFHDEINIIKQHQETLQYKFLCTLRPVYNSASAE